MAKTLTGKVVSTKMEKAVVVEVTRLKPHPLYKKLLKRSKKFKVGLNGQEVVVGQRVKITETKPIGGKHFAISEVIADKHAEPTVAKAMAGKGGDK